MQTSFVDFKFFKPKDRWKKSGEASQMPMTVIIVATAVLGMPNTVTRKNVSCMRTMLYPMT